MLDAVLTEDPQGRVACETLVTTGLVVVAGEITTTCNIPFRSVVRDRIREIGYDSAEYGFNGNTCSVIVAVDEQSPDISRGVDSSYEVQRGEEDPARSAWSRGSRHDVRIRLQGTEELMPFPIMLAHKICSRLAEVRRLGLLPCLVASTGRPR